MDRSKGSLDIDLNKGQGRGMTIFIAAMILFFALLYFFVIKPSQNSEETPVEQNTEQTTPAPTSR